jgi:hypothetical protein
MKVSKSILICMLTIIVSSCGSATDSEEPPLIPTPDIGIEVQANRYLEVTAPDGWNSFKSNESISLMIRNISKQEIAAGPDFGAKIFLRTDDRWIEVKNKTVYLNDGFILEPDENFDPLKIAAIFVLPDLPNYSTTAYIRIYVVGNLSENGKETKKVASYIDLELKP